MKPIYKLSAVLIPLLAITGCASSELTPTAARGDSYIADHVFFSGQTDLVNHIAFGNITRSFDAAGILHITIPVRATTPDDLFVDYHFTYFDENHNPIDVPTSWSAQKLDSNIFMYIQGNSSSPRARDFQIDFRPAQ